MGSTVTSIKKDELKEPIAGYQYDLIQYLYHLEPTQDNLFYCAHFGSYEDKNHSKVEITSADSGLMPDSMFRLKKIDIPGIKFNYEQQKQTRRQFFKGIELPKQVTLEWIDDVYQSVRKYHEDWMSAWYNRENDCMVVGPAGKLRGLDIFQFHMIGDTAATRALDYVQVEIIKCIHLRGLAPTGNPNITLDQGATGNDKSFSVTYTVNKVKEEYFDGSYANAPANGTELVKNISGDEKLWKTSLNTSSDKYTYSM